ILKCCRSAPVLGHGLHGDLYALGLQVAHRGLDIVRPIADVHLRARLHAVIELEQHQARFRSRDAQLDPALLLVERLVRQDAETQLFRVERYGLVLVLDRDACKFDAANHSECTSVDPSTSLRMSPGGLDAAKTAQDPSTSLRISPGGLDAAKT